VRAQLSYDPGEEAVLDRLDASVERLGRVVRTHGDALLREDRPAVDAFVDQVDGRAGLCDAGRELLLDGVRTGNAGSSEGCTFTTASGKRSRKAGVNRCI
jgi:hypothetical protein